MRSQLFFECMYVFLFQSALCASGLQTKYKLGLLYGSSCVTSSRCMGDLSGYCSNGVRGNHPHADILSLFADPGTAVHVAAETDMLAVSSNAGVLVVDIRAACAAGSGPREVDVDDLGEGLRLLQTPNAVTALSLGGNGCWLAGGMADGSVMSKEYSCRLHNVLHCCTFAIHPWSSCAGRWCSFLFAQRARHVFLDSL